jgi:hypothetical protein
MEIRDLEAQLASAQKHLAEVLHVSRTTDRLQESLIVSIDTGGPLPSVR